MAQTSEKTRQAEASKKTRQAELEAVLLERLGALPRDSELRKAKSRAFWEARRRRRRQRGGRQLNGAVCPITLEPVAQLRCPCLASDGGIYEQDAIWRWACTKGTSPLTRRDLLPFIPLSEAKDALRRAGVPL